MSAAGNAMLARAVGGLHGLPTPRGAALELLRLARVENASVGDVARVAQVDPVLAARLIHAANRASQRAAPGVGSINAAVMRLGFSATRQIAPGFSLVSDYRRGACRQFDYKAFWTGSVLRGLAARAIAARLRTGDPQEALSCGLLAGIGRLALATAQPEAYGELLAIHGQNGARLRAAEQARFAIDHGALGVALLDQWAVPPGLVAAVNGYFDPPMNADGPDRSVRRLVWTLLLAEAVAQAAAAPDRTRDAWTHLALDAAALLDAGAAMLTEVADEVAEEAPEWTKLLELPVPEMAALDFPGYAGSEAATKADGAAGLRILAVDDDESDRFLIQRKLEKAGHQVRFAQDGYEALALIAASPPQLVITDIEMPRMNGLEFCRALRETRLGEHLPVIAVTGRQRHEDLVECIHAGANDFVSKSAALDILLARVRAAGRLVACRETLKDELGAVRDFATELAIGKRRLELQAHPA